MFKATEHLSDNPKMLTVCQDACHHSRGVVTTRDGALTMTFARLPWPGTLLNNFAPAVRKHAARAPPVVIFQRETTMPEASEMSSEPEFGDGRSQL